MTENEISYEIRGAIFKIYNKWGPGLLETAYEAALYHEIHKSGLEVKSQVPVNVIWDGVELGLGYKIDLLVEDKVIVEIKSVETVSKVHHKQVITYLKLADKKLGLLVNFNCDEIAKSIVRKVNKL